MLESLPCIIVASFRSRTEFEGVSEKRDSSDLSTATSGSKVTPYLGLPRSGVTTDEQRDLTKNARILARDLCIM